MFLVPRHSHHHYPRLEPHPLGGSSELGRSQCLSRNLLLGEGILVPHSLHACSPGAGCSLWMCYLVSVVLLKINNLLEHLNSGRCHITSTVKTLCYYMGTTGWSRGSTAPRSKACTLQLGTSVVLHMSVWPFEFENLT